MKDSQFYQIMMLLWMILAMVSTTTAGGWIGVVLAAMYAILALYYDTKEKKK